MEPAAITFIMHVDLHQLSGSLPYRAIIRVFAYVYAPPPAAASGDLAFGITAVNESGRYAYMRFRRALNTVKSGLRVPKNTIFVILASFAAFKYELRGLCLFYANIINLRPACKSLFLFVLC